MDLKWLHGLQTNKTIIFVFNLSIQFGLSWVWITRNCENLCRTMCEFRQWNLQLTFWPSFFPFMNYYSNWDWAVMFVFVKTMMSNSLTKFSIGNKIPAYILISLDQLIKGLREIQIIYIKAAHKQLDTIHSEKKVEPKWCRRGAVFENGSSFAKWSHFILHNHV